MKKRIISLIIILMVIVSTPLSAYSEEDMGKENLSGEIIDIQNGINIYNSKYVSSEEINILDVKSSDNIIKIYNIPVVFAFNEYDSIAEIMNSSYISQTFYAVISDEKVLSVQTIDSNLISIEMNEPHSICDMQVLSAFNSEKGLDRVSSDIIVRNVYYLYGEADYQGTALYYETNKGDYVYYRYYLAYGGEYLFPATDFSKFIKDVYSSKMGPDVPPGGINITDVWDLSRYDINSNTFSLDATLQELNANTDLNKNEKTDSNLKTGNETTNQSGFWKLIAIIIPICLLTMGISFVVLLHHRRKGQ